MLDVELGAVSLKNELTLETNGSATRMIHLHPPHEWGGLYPGSLAPLFAYLGINAGACAHMGSKMADELRNKARELLALAEQVDGKRPHVLVVTGGNFDEPTVTVSWSKALPSNRQIGKLMGFDVDEDHEFFARELSLVEML